LSLQLIHWKLNGLRTRSYFLIPNPDKNSTVLWDANWVPLSETIVCDSPNLQMILCQMKFWIDLDEIEATVSASIHFIKYSAATKMYILCPTAVRNGSRMSMPHRSKGHARGYRDHLVWGDTRYLTIELTLLTFSD
jgi:hypothetical protein